jgi:hypothetical protein
MWLAESAATGSATIVAPIITGIAALMAAYGALKANKRDADLRGYRDEKKRSARADARIRLLRDDIVTLLDTLDDCRRRMVAGGLEAPPVPRLKSDRTPDDDLVPDEDDEEP